MSGEEAMDGEKVRAWLTLQLALPGDYQGHGVN